MAEHGIVYFRGDFRPLDEAKISVRSKGLNYGLGCFEGIRAYWNEERERLYIFRGLEHYHRFHRSMRILNMIPPMSPEEMVDVTIELLRRNNVREGSYIRPLAFMGSEALSPTIVEEDNEFVIYSLPLKDYLDTNTGVTACVASWTRISDNMIPVSSKPTAAYLNSALARMEAKSAGFDEAIFLTREGFVCEGSAEHIFIMRDGELITPASSDDNLEGITRETLSTLAREELGMNVVARHVRRSELYVAEEAFFCGTGAEVTPVVKIDGRMVGDGKPGLVTVKLQKLYFSVVHGEIEKYIKWCQPV